jgi:hypothetical protein
MKMAQGECLLCAVAMPEGLMFTLHYPKYTSWFGFYPCFCALRRQSIAFASDAKMEKNSMK